MANNLKDWYGNEVLYRMCAERPLHDDDNIIASKIWLIGRSYAASIERRIVKEVKDSENFLSKEAAPAIRGSGIDKWIASVSLITRPRLTSENLAASLDCHKKTMDLFTGIAGGITKRSLASKYLHFHNPEAFFIYDSRAAQRIKQLTGKRDEDFIYPSGYDKLFSIFCARCIYHRDELEKKWGISVTPRQLDMELLNYGF